MNVCVSNIQQISTNNIATLHHTSTSSSTATNWEVPSQRRKQSPIPTPRSVILYRKQEISLLELFLHESNNPAGVTFLPFPFASRFSCLFDGGAGAGPFVRSPLGLDGLSRADDLPGAGGGALCTPGLHIADGGEPIILEIAHGRSYPAKPTFCTYRAISRCKVG